MGHMMRAHAIMPMWNHNNCIPECLAAFGSSGSVLDASGRRLKASGGFREASGSARSHMERSNSFRHSWENFMFYVFG